MSFLRRFLNSFWLLCPVLCPAGVVVTQNIAPGATSWPGSPLIQTVTNPAVQVAVGESFNAVGGCTNYTQTFTVPATNFTLQAISIYAGGGSGTGVGTNLTLRLFDLGAQSAPNPSPYSPGSDLFNSGNGLAITYAPQTVGVLRFDFTGSDQVTLQAGRLYAFEMNGVLNSSPLQWQRTISDTYAGGAAYRNQTWINGNNAREFALAVYGTGTATNPPVSATINANTRFQTIEGFGGAICFYNGWVTAHPYKNEILTNAFAGLNLSMLRLGNWFRYQGTTNFDPDAPGIVAKANQVLGRPVPILMCSWAPPAFLKSNGQVGNGGTLLSTNGGFAYNEFAQYWYDSLRAYGSNGVSPSWISIQNEPDWAAGYDSCVFKPTEGVVNGTNYASYSKALDATFQRLTNLPAPPKMLAPEVLGIGYNNVQNYAATMNANSFYGVGYHLYHGSSDGTPDGYISSFRAVTNVFPTKPRFMTEYGVSNMIDSATLIHNALTEGQVSGYNFWSLIWPVDGLGLIQIEFPWDQSRWTNAPTGTTTQSHGWWFSPAYWSMKHFSYYVTPGFERVGATCSDANVRVSAYVAPDNQRLVAVFINRSANTVATVTPNFSSFSFNTSSVYQTAGTSKFLPLGAVGSQLTLPAASLTTVVLDKTGAVGPPLSLNLTATTLTLSWPETSTGYTLQSRTNLLLGNWGNVTTPAPQIVSGQWRVTLPRTSGAGETYYRLAK